MSGNSADSITEDSEAEDEKEEVKEKAEAMVKKKGPGRPPRKKRPPVASAASPPVASKRRCTPPKSGNRPHVGFLPNKYVLFILNFSYREARRAEAPLVGGGASRGGDSPEQKPHGTARPCESRLRALPGTLPPAGEQPEGLEGHQVLRPQSHPAPEEAGEARERCCRLLEKRPRPPCKKNLKRRKRKTPAVIIQRSLFLFYRRLN